MSYVSRRSFLSITGTTVAGVALGARVLRAAIPDVPRLRAAVRRTTARHWLPDPTSPDMLRMLATNAIDAARQAGADFADVRVGEHRGLKFEFGVIPAVDTAVGYGVRVLVNGSWGFVHGQILTADGVTSVARQAVSVARGYAAVNASIGVSPVVLAPVPVVKAEWTSPCEIDPFAVPIDDHLRWNKAMAHATDVVYGVTCKFDCAWEEATRVYASTEGALITQYTTQGNVAAGLETFPGRRGAQNAAFGMGVPGLTPRMGGFELALAPDLRARIVASAHEAVRLAEVPVLPFDEEGRFPVVFDGETVAQIAGVSFGCLLDSDRASGSEADASGTTYLAPPGTVLATKEPTFSPLITINADRALPASIARKWDDEGVATGSLDLVENGQVKHYLATRETAAMNGVAPLVGCLTAPSEDGMPMVGGLHLGMSPGEHTATIEDLVRDMAHGFLVRGAAGGLEPGLTTGTIDGELYEIKQGREVSRTRNLQVLFQTRHFWKQQLRAIGDASTVMTTAYSVAKGMPWQHVSNVGSAPAAAFVDVDITRNDITLL